VAQTPEPTSHPAPRIIKRYAGRRLYDPGACSYVTVDQLRAIVRSGTDVVIRDAEDGADITRSVLTNH
jgi:polyhydroxyalkanoate synthesis repressor PhaR